MSDALSDIARDERRGRYYDEYIDKLKCYLEDPSDDNHSKVLESAKNVDSVRPGYSGGKTNLCSGMDERLKLLSEDDKSEWVKLLNSISQHPQYLEFQKISPFKDSMLIEVDYGSGFVSINIHGLKNAINNMFYEKDYRTYDRDKYLITIPTGNLVELLKNSDITWMRCSYDTTCGPRNRSGQKRVEKPKIVI